MINSQPVKYITKSHLSTAHFDSALLVIDSVGKSEWKSRDKCLRGYHYTSLIFDEKFVDECC